MLDQNTVKRDSFNLMKHLCETAGSISRDISISEIFSDKKVTVEATAGEGSGYASREELLRKQMSTFLLIIIPNF